MSLSKNTTKEAENQVAEEKIITYKGFDKNLKCLGYQYDIGKEYEAEGKIEACSNGFHACEAPLDCFRYYAPGQSRYCQVEQSGELSRDGEDTKVASRRIKIGAEIGIPGLVKAQIEYVKAHTTAEHTGSKRATAGDSGAATAGGSGAATAGNFGAATAGNFGAATAGYRGAATAGDSGAATAGNFGAATAGGSGAATAGYRGAATAGDFGAATSRGSASVGKNGIACVRGMGVKVRGGMGAILVIGIESSNGFDIQEWKAVVVDGETVKADTWYTLKDNELVEITDEADD